MAHLQSITMSKSFYFSNGEHGFIHIFQEGAITSRQVLCSSILSYYLIPNIEKMLPFTAINKLRLHFSRW